MASFSRLSVTTSAGTTTFDLGTESTITLDSPGGPAGTPAANSRTLHAFTGFLEHGPNNVDEPYAFEGKIYPPDRSSRVSGLSYSAGVITVTETGHGFSNVPTADLVTGVVRFKPVTDPAWTQTTDVTVDNASQLVVSGSGPSSKTPLSLAGLSAISLVEAS